MKADEGIDDAIGQILEAFGVARAAVYVRDPEQPLFRMWAFRDSAGLAIPPGAREYAWGKGLVGGAAERSEALSTSDSDVYSLAAPMLLGDEAVGILAVGGGRGHRLTPLETEALLLRARALARRLAAPPLQALQTELSRRLAGPALAWLATAIEAALRGEREAVANAFPAVSRRVGRDALGSSSALVLRDLDVEVPLRAWRVDDAARVALLCAFAEHSAPRGIPQREAQPQERRADGSEVARGAPGPAARRDPSRSEPSDAGESSASPPRDDARLAAEALARELYFGGDLRERAGALRALAVVGRGEVALDAMLDACRVAAVELFEAAIADNPCASRVLPDDEFRKVVLKCAFVGVSLARVAGLERRADAELSRMLLSYVTEREVAGRSVPPDIWPIAALHPPPGLAAKLCGYLEHPAEEHRAAAALALGRIADGRARPFLDDRLVRETDAAVRRALERAIS